MLYRHNPIIVNASQFTSIENPPETVMIVTEETKLEFNRTLEELRVAINKENGGKLKNREASFEVKCRLRKLPPSFIFGDGVLYGKKGLELPTNVGDAFIVGPLLEDKDIYPANHMLRYNEYVKLTLGDWIVRVDSQIILDIASEFKLNVNKTTPTMAMRDDLFRKFFTEERDRKNIPRVDQVDLEENYYWFMNHLAASRNSGKINGSGENYFHVYLTSSEIEMARRAGYSVEPGEITKDSNVPFSKVWWKP